MTKLHELVDFLDRELNISEIPDYSGALNGLQLENPGEVTKIGAAVDASLPVIDKAVSEGVDLLFKQLHRQVRRTAHAERRVVELATA